MKRHPRPDEVVSAPPSPESTTRYVYKVLVAQMPRTFLYVEATSIEEAERHGIVVLLVGPAD